MSENNKKGKENSHIDSSKYSIFYEVYSNSIASA
jgi:hypothetical protein